MPLVAALPVAAVITALATRVAAALFTASSTATAAAAAAAAAPMWMCTAATATTAASAAAAIASARGKRRDTAESTPVELITVHDGMRLVTGPLRLEPSDGGPCLSPWRLEQRGSRRWLRGDEGTRLALRDAGGVGQVLCLGPGCLRCLSRGSRNRMAARACWKGDHEAVVVQGVVQAAWPLAEPACSYAALTPAVWVSAAAPPPQLLAVAVAVAVAIAALQLHRQQKQISRSRLALARASGAAREARLSWREARDATRPLQLVTALREGTHAEEVSVVDPSGKLLMSWAEGLLRLSDDHGALVLTPPPSKLSLLTTRHRISLAELSGLRYAEDLPEALRLHAAQSAKKWATRRCLRLSTLSREYVVRFSSDWAALLWLEGLQALLHAAGLLLKPIRPAALLWLRARTRLSEASREQGLARGRLLAKVIRESAAPSAAPS
ncbi:hypothetical protein EMIHUDRAFT_440960, partial [Emiliania huxleyi CCMP1516]|uniref:PH domain-containing protein n=2 Tax=Emiliania huxleyi TaxID=2903 RepID=A0A0D3KIV2_EMIH1